MTTNAESPVRRSRASTPFVPVDDHGESNATRIGRPDLGATSSATTRVVPSADFSSAAPSRRGSAAGASKRSTRSLRTTPVSANFFPRPPAERVSNTPRAGADDTSVAHAAERNVVINFEPLAPSETNFVNTHTEAIQFVQQLESPNFKVILDVKAMCSMGKPIPEIIRESAGEFGYFHANDENLKGPGFGDVDFKPIGAALKEVSYDGVVSVEVFKFDEGPEAIAAESLRYLQKTFA